MSQSHGGDAESASAPRADTPIAEPPEPVPEAPGGWLGPRWLLILAWSIGPAAVYALMGLLHAALVERILSVDVGFGRGLAFWIVSIYLALLTWGFLPARPTGWYARRRPIMLMLAVGIIGALVCGAFTGLWLMAHWAPAIGVPVLSSMVVLLAAGMGVLWLAGRADTRR
jgi:hypothetical protein